MASARVTNLSSKSTQIHALGELHNYHCKGSCTEQHYRWTCPAGINSDSELTGQLTQMSTAPWLEPSGICWAATPEPPRRQVGVAAPQQLGKVFSLAKIIPAINWTRVSSLINNFFNKQMLIIFTGFFFFLSYFPSLLSVKWSKVRDVPNEWCLEQITQKSVVLRD